MYSVNYFPIIKALLLLHLLIYFINCVHWCLSVYVHESAGAWGGQKKTLDSLELELQAIVSYLVIGSGTQMLVLWKSSKHFNCQAISPGPTLIAPLFVWGFVCFCASVCGGQRTACGSQLSWIKLVFGSKYIYLLSHLSGPIGIS